MKKYSTSEAMSIIERKPQQKFISNHGQYKYELCSERGYFYFRIFDKGGCMKPTYQGCGGFNGNITINLQWELVQKPAPFMEAAKAFDEEGKTIRCEYPSFRNKAEILTERFIPGIGNSMREEDEISFHMINKGKWYIEESEE